MFDVGAFKNRAAVNSLGEKENNDMIGCKDVTTFCPRYCWLIR
jgi:hypothetical protein